MTMWLQEEFIGIKGFGPDYAHEPTRIWATMNAILVPHMVRSDKYSNKWIRRPK